MRHSRQRTDTVGTMQLIFWNRFFANCRRVARSKYHEQAEDQWDSFALIEVNDGVPYWVLVPEVAQTTPSAYVRNRSRLDELRGILSATVQKRVEHGDVISGVLGGMVASLVKLHELHALLPLKRRRKLGIVTIP